MPQSVKPTLTQSEPELPVFVYGTLRPGQKNFLPFLGGRVLRTVPASIEGRLYFVRDGGYPYLLPEPGRVAGDLAFLDPRLREETLGGLDSLEEYDPLDEDHSIYLRRQAKVTLADGGHVTAWVYYWNCPDIQGIWISSGDFLEWMGTVGPERGDGKGKSEG